LYPVVPVVTPEGLVPVVHVGRFNCPVADKAPVTVIPVEAIVATVVPAACKANCPLESPVETMPPNPELLAFIIDANFYP